MDYLSQYKRQLAIKLFLAIGMTWALVVASGAVAIFVFSLDPLYMYVFLGSIGLSTTLIATSILTSRLAAPLEVMSDIIAYASHSNRTDHAPDVSRLPIARDLVQALGLEIYDLASSQPAMLTSATDTTAHNDQSNQSSLFDILNVPIIGLNGVQQVTFVNQAASTYIAKPVTDIINKPLFDVLNLSFQSDDNLESWLQNAKQNSVRSSKTWERVKHGNNNDTIKQFDLTASFSSGNSTGTETVLAIFDKTDQYNQDNQEISFVAMAVHELRTPLTIMRGYIEVFEDELGPTLAPEMTDFMHKMHASAQQLAAFVSNILNVARIEEDQLALKLRSEDWAGILRSAVDDLELRARVHGKHIELQIAENLPPIAADRISIHEVINNLVDNAIKYSGSADKIVVTSQMNSDGMIETSVQDFGLGIPTAVMGQLFQKFHRSHKSSIQVGGTGLGLFLCRALVVAHGGNIWVRSKEGEGSIFSFTLLPFDKISSEQIASEDGIIRGAHGWIKNHSLYRS